MAETDTIVKNGLFGNQTGADETKSPQGAAAAPAAVAYGVHSASVASD